MRFKDLKIGDYIHIVSYLGGGYIQSLLIDNIESNGEDLLLSTTNGRQFKVNPNETHELDEEYEDIYLDEESAMAMVREHDKHLQQLLLQQHENLLRKIPTY